MARMRRAVLAVDLWQTICMAAVLNRYFVAVEGIARGQVVANESKSSPSQITVMKMSSVWLHWNYTYGGDSALLRYHYQTITYRNRYSTTPVELARRPGPSGTLSKLSSISDPIAARIDVISNNSTLVVHHLRYNDSGSNFSSYIQMTYNFGLLMHRRLKPVATIDVKDKEKIEGKYNFSKHCKAPCAVSSGQDALTEDLTQTIGAPEFILSPPTAVSVSENSNLELKVQMDGNPKPTAIFQWPHDGSKDQSIPGTLLYPYICESRYTLNNIPASYCGRTVDIRIQNSVGAVTKKTNVIVLLKLDADPNLRARKPAPNCVEVKWNRAESGACFVKYEIQFKNASHVITTKVAYNTGWTASCFLPGMVNITNVQLTLSFKRTRKTFTAKVSERPIPTAPVPTDKATTATIEMMTQTTAQEKDAIITGLAAVVAIETTFIVIIIVLWFVKGRRSLQPVQKRNQETFGNNSQDEMHYMEMKQGSLEPDSNYASLQPQYEVPGKKATEYENVDRVART